MLQYPMFERYDELVALAYSGIAEPKPWQAFVDCLAEVVDGRDSSMVISTRRNPQQAMLVTSDPAPHITQNYLEQTLATDVMASSTGWKCPSPPLSTRCWASTTGCIAIFIETISSPSTRQLIAG